MYIQITDHCNMTCAHCGYSCSPRKKNFMTMDVFKKAVELTDYNISIGGGEPTTHPLFWEMLIHAIAYAPDDDSMVWLATNGKRTEDAMRLVRMCRRGLISCDLSQDEWHEPIETRVYREFNKKDENMAIRTTRQISKIGRGRNFAGAKNICICEDTFVAPNGDVYSCGCKKHKFGHVFDKDLSVKMTEWSNEHDGYTECAFC